MNIVKTILNVKINEFICKNGKLISNPMKENYNKNFMIFNEKYKGISTSIDYDTLDEKILIKYALSNMKNSKLLDIGNIHFQNICNISEAFYICKYDINDINIFLKKIDDYILNKNLNLHYRDIFFRIFKIDRELETNFNLEVSCIIMRCELYITLGKNYFNEIHDFIDGTYLDIINNLDKIYSRIDLLCKELLDKISGVFVSREECTCIIDSNITGLLVHEVIGHLLESDVYTRNKILKLGMKLKNKNINVIDFANYISIEGGSLISPTFFDNEGILSKNVELIKNGRIINLMNNLEGSNVYNLPLTGNCYTFYNNISIVRMRNTVLMPGNENLNEMINSINYGYYLKRPGNGFIDKNGRFNIEIVSGYKIESGKITQAIKNSIIEGYSIDLLNSIEMISNKVKITGGICTKVRKSYLGMGGPDLKCKVNIYSKY